MPALKLSKSKLILIFILAFLIGTPFYSSGQETNVEETSECDGTFKEGSVPTPETLQRILKEHSKWLSSNKREGKQANLCKASLGEANLAEADLRGANLAASGLMKANLQKADLAEANLQKATLREANLEEADLYYANLERADLGGANLQKANLAGANLEEARLGEANLQNADLEKVIFPKAKLDKETGTIDDTYLSGANLKEADISYVDLNRVAFDLKPGGIPLVPSFAKAKNLEKLLYVDPPHSLVEIRNGFKQAGMREQERILTYIIKHGEMENAWKNGGFLGKVESLFSWVLFDITCEWGKTPGRPLRILGLLVLIFTLPYSFVIKRKYLFKRPAVWRSWLKDHIGTFENSAVVGKHFFFPKTRLWIRKKTWKSRKFRLVRRWFETIAVLFGGFYFSLLSAFNLGWRDLNVGTWISRIQPRQYYLWSSGWVRSLSAVQSIISVYLLALWALTYFGRPFE